MRDLEPRLFGYIWRYSRRDQLAICLVVLASLPFYFASLDLPRRIVNDAIAGKAFQHGNATTPFLDLTIHWPTWLGGDGTVNRVFEGLQLGRSELLFGLSLMFLGLVLINGAFKFYINLTKGILGERMLRRLRFQLFSLMLRFTPETMREVKSSETATIIRDEVEPIGTFIGDAVVVPAFLGTQAATALAFILMQNVWLGLVAGGIVAVQIVVIPRLRREIIRLSRRRQLASRSFAGRVGEVLDGLETVTVNDAGRWERAEIGGRLYGLFDLRLKIYKRKFLVKYLNNLLAQVTPFLFYAIGGMFALRGQLDIGQLVAVLAAYRDLPPPLKELIDWDQQRLDVEVKYETVAAHFAPHRLRPDADAEPAVGALGTPLRSRGVSLHEPHGGSPLEIADFTVTLPAQLALISPGGQASRIFGRVLAGLATPRNGTVSIGGHDLTTVPQPARGRQIAYAGPEPAMFPGTIRDNILYGLRRHPPGADERNDDTDGRRLFEARVSGNPAETVDDPWIDFAASGVANMAGLDARMLELLERLGLGEDLYRFGLTMRSTVRHDTPLGRRVIAARTHLRSHFALAGRANLVIPFDRQRYNPQAAIAENLLFGVPRDAALIGRSLAGEPRFRAALSSAGLLDELAQMGVAIGRNLIEIFRDVPPGHPLFRRYSTIAPEELPEFERRLVGLGRDGALSPADSEAFLALALSYIEPRQRLGLLDKSMRARLILARGPVRLILQGPDGDDVEPYDPRRINSRSSILDNLLFGRIDTAQMHGEAFIQREVRAVVQELDLENAIRLRGLDYEVGNRGRNLTLRQQILIDLVRAIVRMPEILVVDGALEHLEGAAETLSAIMTEALPDATHVSIISTLADAHPAATIVDLTPLTDVAQQGESGTRCI
ncbi:ABC transporter ATP-binding protein [Methylobacterium sp. J-078]|uniref:ABC transporter transmembrane domain-containing protein n=1 Tax=Methylobacterium sp. J-078 TaxID=2836657 RepID=UPI001FBC0C38|nr:ABC transporter transmembrane domain-containing protein [Methylobacterium sp. J-078]MCJ2046858.1 ABC transporter ATP-binding protein [Methylobacterium sp. J-078]